MNASRLIDAIPAKSADERRQMRENALRLVERGGPRAIMAKMMLAALDRFEQTVDPNPGRAAHRTDRAPADAANTSDARNRANRFSNTGQPPATRSARVAMIVAAFRQIPMSETDQHLVQVLLDHPDTPSEQLSEAMGWQGNGWHLHFGSMCRKREHLLWLAPEIAGTPFYSGILTNYDGRTHGYTLIPAAVEAFARLGLRSRDAP
jgi:hypothetical protein